MRGAARLATAPAVALAAAAVAWIVLAGTADVYWTGDFTHEVWPARISWARGRLGAPTPLLWV